MKHPYTDRTVRGVLDLADPYPVQSVDDGGVDELTGIWLH